MFRRRAILLAADLNGFECFGKYNGDGPTINTRRMQIDLRTEFETQGHMYSSQTRYHKDLTVAKGMVRQTQAPYWSQQRRPTHFLSLRVPDSSILKRQFLAFHEITERDMPQYLPLLVPKEKLHVTLAVMSIDNEDESVDQIEDMLMRELGNVDPFTLRFHGLGTFQDGRVVFARIQSELSSYRLDKHVTNMRKRMALDFGIDVKGNPYDNFIPHATWAKVSKKAKESLGHNLREVPRELFDPQAYDDLGTVTFDTVELCSMKGAGEDGFYRSLLRCEL